MTFHRLTVPSYSGGLRGGDDYINNAASGTPAPADTVLAAGLYAGSYFFAANTPVTGASINRGLRALANNTDLLDNRVTVNEINIAGFTTAFQTYADAGDVATLVAAKAYADARDVTALNSAKSYADAGDVTTLNSAKAYADIGDALRIPLTQRGAANGVATLNGSSKVPSTQLSLALLSAQFVDFLPAAGGALTSASTSYVDVTGTQGIAITVVSCLAGDILVIDATFMIAETGGGTNGNVRLVALDPSVIAVCNAEPWSNTSANGIQSGNISALYIVAGSGSIVVKAQMHGAGGNSISVFQGSNLRVLHYRP